MFELPWALKTSPVLFYFLMECYGRATNPKLPQQERLAETQQLTAHQQEQQECRKKSEMVEGNTRGYVNEAVNVGMDVLPRRFSTFSHSALAAIAFCNGWHGVQETSDDRQRCPASRPRA